MHVDKGWVKINCNALWSTQVCKTVCLRKSGPVSNMHQLNYKTSMSNSRYGLSAQFWRTMAWSYAFKTWPFRNLFVKIFLPALSYLWWEKSTIHFACNGFTTKSRTSTLVSWCATPRPSCAATWSAYQVWYLSGRKHLENLLRFIYLTVGKGRFC